LDFQNTEFIPSMSFESVVGHQLICHLFCESRLKAPTNINACQFCSLGFVLSRQFSALSCQVSFFCVCLGTHRDVFTGSHGHGARDEAGNSCDYYTLPGGAGGCNPQDETRRRYYAVVRAQDSSTKPPDTLGSMAFFMAHILGDLFYE
jgi:hypothetical protein